MLFLQICKFSTYEYFFCHVANPNNYDFTDFQPSEKYLQPKPVKSCFFDFHTSVFGKFREFVAVIKYAYDSESRVHNWVMS